jgi:hypothetical protein
VQNAVLGEAGFDCGRTFDFAFVTGSSMAHECAIAQPQQCLLRHDNSSHRLNDLAAELKHGGGGAGRAMNRRGAAPSHQEL